MGKLAFLIVLLVLISIPPISRVVDPEQCIGICLDWASPEQIIVIDDEGGS